VWRVRPAGPRHDRRNVLRRLEGGRARRARLRARLPTRSVSS